MRARTIVDAMGTEDPAALNAMLKDPVSPPPLSLTLSPNKNKGTRALHRLLLLILLLNERESVCVRERGRE